MMTWYIYNKTKIKYYSNDSENSVKHFLLVSHNLDMSRYSVLVLIFLKINEVNSCM